MADFPIQHATYTFLADDKVARAEVAMHTVWRVFVARVFRPLQSEFERGE